MPRTLILWIVAAFAAYPVYVVGQTPAVGPAVSIPFFASDARDKAVSDVTPADVEVLDNKKPPQSVVEIRGASELPLRLGVLISTSGSETLSKVYPDEVEAASDLLTRVLNGATDTAFVEKFGREATATEFLSRGELGPLAIDNKPFGPSAFYDAIGFACDERMSKNPLRFERRVIVLIGDGHDNASHIDHKQAIARAQTAGVVIFALDTETHFSTFGGGDDDSMLEQFAEQSGGLAFLHLDRKDVPKVFATIKEQIDNMRVLSYVPAAPLQNGQRRSLELKSASNRKLKLRAPKAYYLNATTQ